MIARPGGAELPAERSFTFAACEDKDGNMWKQMFHHFQNQMAGCAESAQAQIPAVLQAGQPEGAIAHCAGAQQRRRLRIRKKSGNGMGEDLRHRQIRSISAVMVSAGRFKVRAQVLSAAAAVGAGAAGGMNPGDAGPVVEGEFLHLAADRDHPADDLMPRNQGQMGGRRPPLDFIDLSVADPAYGNREQKLVLCDNRLRPIDEAQRLVVAGERAELFQDHCFHKGLRPFPSGDEGDSRLLPPADQSTFHFQFFTSGIS